MKRIMTIMLAIFCFALPFGADFARLQVDASTDTPPTKVELALDNFDDYDFLDMHANLFVLTKDDCIAKVTQQNVVLFDSADYATGIQSAKFAMQIEDNRIAVVDSLCGVQIYDANFEYIKTCRIVSAVQDGTESKYVLGEVSDACKDYVGNLYLADYTNDKILLLKQGADAFEEVNLNLNGSNFEQDTKICINPNGDLLAVLCSGSLSLYNLKDLSKQSTILCSGSKILFDFENNLFAVDGDNIKKFSAESHEQIASKNLGMTPKCTILDVETGEFYLLNADGVYRYFSDELATSAKSQSLPVDITSTETNSNCVTIAKATADTKLFATCVSFASGQSIQKDSLVLVLTQDVQQNQSMAFCLAIVDGSQKMGYIKKADLSMLPTENLQQNCKTICQSVPVLTYPATNAGVCKTIESEGQVVMVNSNLYGFADENSESYFAVSTPDGIGYVQQRYLTNTDSFESVKIDVEPTDNHTTEFVAFLIVVLALALATAFACVMIAKKKDD